MPTRRRAPRRCCRSSRSGCRRSAPSATSSASCGSTSSTSTRRCSCRSAGTRRRRARRSSRPREVIADTGAVVVRGRRARAAAPRAGRGARLEGRRPVHGDPRRGHRPDRDAAAVRHARGARSRADARAARRAPIAAARAKGVCPDDPRRRPGLARPLRRGLVELRRGRDRRPVQRGRRVPLPPVGRARSSAATRSSRTGSTDKDEPGSWTAHYDVWTLDGDRASAIGESRYTNPDGSFRTLYYNNWTLRFDGARPLRRVRRVLHGAARAPARGSLTGRGARARPRPRDRVARKRAR